MHKAEPARTPPYVVLAYMNLAFNDRPGRDPRRVESRDQVIFPGSMGEFFEFVD